MTTAYPLEDEFGDIIKKARVGLDLSIDHTAAGTGVSEDMIKRMEAYELKPTETEVHALADLLKLAPEKLYAIACEQYQPPAAHVNSTDIAVEMLTGERGQANCYVIADKRSQVSVIVDPGVDATRIEKALAAVQYPLAAVLVTHAHGDHTQSLRHFSERTSGTPAQYKTLETPGHSEDSKSYRFAGCVFVGDLLFAGSIGRALPGRDWYDIHRQSAQTILDMPPQTVIFPGHGPATTVASERENNPFF